LEAGDNALIQKEIRPVPGWTLLLFLGTLVVLCAILGLSAAFLIPKSLLPESLSVDDTLVMLLICYGVGLLATVLAVAPLGRAALPALAVRPANWRFVALGPVATLALSFLATQFGPDLQGMRDIEKVIRQPDALVLSLVAIGVLAPLVEELVFRGLLYGWLEGRWGWRPAFAVSALAFAIAHYQWSAKGWAQLSYALAVLPLGLLFSWLRKRTRSLLPSVVSHMVNNSVAVLGAFFGS
jgi:membrane protease YdiL (CAAX protease family)